MNAMNPKPWNVMYMVKDSSITIRKMTFEWRNKKNLHKILDTTM